MSGSINIQEPHVDDAGDSQPWRCYVDPAMTVEELAPACDALDLHVAADRDGVYCLQLNFPDSTAPTVEALTQALFPTAEGVIASEESGAFKTLEAFDSEAQDRHREEDEDLGVR